MQEPVAGPEGGEKGVAGESGGKRPEHLANRVKRRAANGEFGHGAVVCGGIHGKFYTSHSHPLRVARNFVGKFSAAVSAGRGCPQGE